MTTPQPWSAADLAAWQARLGLSGAAAARLLGMPYLSYRAYLTGRRRADGLPETLRLLCGYVERERAAAG